MPHEDPATALEQRGARGPRWATAYVYGDEGAEGVSNGRERQELIAGAAEWAETAATRGTTRRGRGEGATLIERY